ncbi:Protein SDA1 [Quaeritorhiza haematococci]|nr:Protein SDA1 [Quaeritorhiza haematococci]
MGKRQRGETLNLNLPQLQNLIKRDPTSYKDEFRQQYNHFDSQISIFKLKPDEEAEEFGQLVMFLAHVAPCYREECKAFPQQLIDLLTEYHQILAPELRRTFVQALMLLRNRNMISTERLLSLFFTLFRCHDKNLRTMLHTHIVNDIKNANAKAKNHKLNKTLQNLIYSIFKDSNEMAARKSLEVMIDLYKKNVWNDAKTVNAIAEACLSPMPKIVAIAVHFFLGSSEREEEKDSDDESAPDITGLKHMMHINKKTKSRKTQMEKALANMKKKERRKNRDSQAMFSALQLLNDPQSFAEKLFSRLRSSASSGSHNLSLRMEMRLKILNLVTRLVGTHKLLLLGLYDYLIPYLKPSQRDVTCILAYAAQASHDLVPPDVLEPVVEAIANQFVWTNCANEVICAGINGLREICSRCPLAMPETLLQSLIADYKNFRDKGVMMAARSLLGLYREINPVMLRKKDRGKTASLTISEFKAPKYGEVKVFTDVDGAELLNEKEDDSEDEDGDDSEELDLDELDWDNAVEVGDDELDGEDDDEDGEEGEDDEEAEMDSEDGGELYFEGFEVDSDEEDDENDESVELDDEDLEELSELDSDDLEEIEGDSDDDSDSGEVDESSEGSPPKKLRPNPPTPTKTKSKTNKAEVSTSENATTEKSKSKPVAAEKILTDEDFARMRKLRARKELEKAMGAKGGNNRISIDDVDDDEDEDEDDGDKEFVDVSAITSGIKRKRDYEARMESIKAGREGREKYGSKKGSKERSSLTNKEKAKKTKAFMMIVHKRDVKAKAKRSLVAKQKILRAHIKKQKMKK